MSNQQIVSFVKGNTSWAYRQSLINGWLVRIVDWSTVRAVCSK